MDTRPKSRQEERTRRIDGSVVIDHVDLDGADRLGSLNEINALLFISGQGSGDRDVLHLNDSGDTTDNFGTLTGSQVRNGITASTGGDFLLLGPNGPLAASSTQPAK